MKIYCSFRSAGFGGTACVSSSYSLFIFVNERTLKNDGMVLVCDVYYFFLFSIWLAVVVVWVKCFTSTPKSDGAEKMKEDVR